MQCLIRVYIVSISTAISVWKNSGTFKWQMDSCYFCKGKKANWAKRVNNKGKGTQKYKWFYLKVFGKMHIWMQTAWKSDSYFLRYCDYMFSKWLPMGAAILKQTLNLKVFKQLFLKSMYRTTHTHFTNVIFVYYINNHFMGSFYEYYTFIRHYWKKLIYTVS